MRSYSLALFAGAMAALAGCATRDPIIQPCPLYGILGDADQLTAFGAAGQGLNDVAYRVKLGDVAFKCSYHGVKRQLEPNFMPREEEAPPDSGSYDSLNGPPAAANSALCASDDEDGSAGHGQSGAAHRDFGHVDGTLEFTMTVERGPAIGDTRITVPYFVAVMRGDKAVLARQEYTTSFDLAAGPHLVGSSEVPIRIPLARGTTGASYEVLVGLVLTPDQLAYNRQRRSK